MTLSANPWLPLLPLRRRNAPAAVQPLLNAFPLPSGPDLGNGTAAFSAGFDWLYSDEELAEYAKRADVDVGQLEPAAGWPALVALRAVARNVKRGPSTSTRRPRRPAKASRRAMSKSQVRYLSSRSTVHCQLQFLPQAPRS